MSKKSIIKAKYCSKDTYFEEVIEVSCISNDTIFIKLGINKILLTAGAAEELAHQIISDVKFLKSKKL